MKRLLAIGAGAGLVSLVLVACDVSVTLERGSGNIISESRDVAGFNEVVLLGSGSVSIIVDGTESLTVETDDNLMDNVKTEVRNGRLELSIDGSFTLSQEVVYTITAADLDAVSVEGSGTVIIEGVDSGRFSVDISGSGEVHVSGAADDLTLSISGSGEYDGEDLTSETGHVDISGSGEALINVTDELEVTVSGSGDVEYIGDPDLTSNISGSGNIGRR